MYNKSTCEFHDFLLGLEVAVAYLENEVACTTSEVMLSGSQLLDAHYKLAELAERLSKCSNRIPQVEISDTESLNDWLEKWESGDDCSPDFHTAPCLEEAYATSAQSVPENLTTDTFAPESNRSRSVED